MSSHVSATARRERATASDDGALLRVALKLDAVVTGANGLVYVAGANLIDSTLGLPASYLRPAGVFLLLFAAMLWGPRANRRFEDGNPRRLGCGSARSWAHLRPYASAGSRVKVPPSSGTTARRCLSSKLRTRVVW